MEEFNERLRKAMQIRGMKQIELAEKTQMSRGAISCYYSGKREPMSRQLTLIAKALDVSETWLMGYDVPMDRPERVKLKDSILEDFEQLTPEQQKVIVSMIHELAVAKHNFKPN